MVNMHTFNHTHGGPKDVWKKAEGRASQVSGITVFNTPPVQATQKRALARDIHDYVAHWEECTR
eukprot:467383-Pleurochrysis_carterae.AAC.1